MTGDEVKAIRHALGEALGRRISVAEMAHLVGLAPANGKETFMKWEKSGPSGPGAVLLDVFRHATNDGRLADRPTEEAIAVLERFGVIKEGVSGGVLMDAVERAFSRIIADMIHERLRTAPQAEK